MFIRGYVRLCEAPLPKITFQRFIMKAKVSLMFTTMSLTKESQKGIIQLMEQIEVNRRFWLIIISGIIISEIIISGKSFVKRWGSI